MTRPPLMPPPPSATVNAGPQWSRPAFLLMRGVRPNSPVTMHQRRVEQAAVGQVAEQRRQAGVERGQQLVA